MAALSRAFQISETLPPMETPTRMPWPTLQCWPAKRVRAAVDDGQPVPQRRPFRGNAEIHTRAKEVARAIIPVEVGPPEQRGQRRPYHLSA